MIANILENNIWNSEQIILKQNLKLYSLNLKKIKFLFYYGSQASQGPCYKTLEICKAKR